MMSLEDTGCAICLWKRGIMRKGNIIFEMGLHFNREIFAARRAPNGHGHPVRYIHGTHTRAVSETVTSTSIKFDTCEIRCFQRIFVSRPVVRPNRVTVEKRSSVLFIDLYIPVFSCW